MVDACTALTRPYIARSRSTALARLRPSGWCKAAVGSLGQIIRSKCLQQVFHIQVKAANGRFQVSELSLIIAVVHDHLVAAAHESVVRKPVKPTHSHLPPVRDQWIPPTRNWGIWPFLHCRQ